ncbi:hypothetical protein BH20ACT2_BH20ACT2_15920 [soil metagenome]
MGVVVLHPERRQVEIERELGGEVLRMQVMDHQRRIDADEVTEVVHRLEEGLVGGEVLEIAEVVAGDHRRAVGDGHGALQLGADGEHRPPGRYRQRQRFRCEAPRSAQHLGTGPGGQAGTGNGSHDRVVAANVDGPVVGEDGVDQRAEAGAGVVVLVSDGLVAHVAAGQQQRTAHSCGE